QEHAQRELLDRRLPLDRAAGQCAREGGDRGECGRGRPAQRRRRGRRKGIPAEPGRAGWAALNLGAHRSRAIAGAQRRTATMVDAGQKDGVQQPLSGGTLIAGTVALSLATFMNVLDTSIANVSLPSIAGDLGVSPEQGTWVITSFGVANAISLPLTGWLSERYGQVRLFVASILLFVIASLACGLAPSLGLLIFFRIVQGF